MADSDDPSRTQRDAGFDVITELSTAGFEDAEEIGRGGFGAVYRCRQVGVERTVAVKVITEELDDNHDRFLREQQAMGQLTGHPNIVSLLVVGTTEHGHPYLVMPYYERGSIQQCLHRDGPLPLQDVLHLGVKLAGALETAHRTGILHRDIKPANILLTDYDEPALTDFGIAHMTGGFETTTGVITGSPAFTAPEVLTGDAPSRAADVYSLGATLFCVLTGHAAFERRSGEQLVAQFLRITEQPAPPLRGSGFPDDVCAVIEDAMARDPADRPDAATMGERLREAQRGHGFPVDRMPVRSAPGSAPTGPPEPAAARDGGNLPIELTSFVGRRTELAEVTQLLARSSLVTLTGIGGVGKSRLALHVAHEVMGDFADGVWLVELGEVRDPALLVDVVAGALGLRGRGAGPTVDVLAGYLSARRLLLVLDNCEQVIDAVTSLTETLLGACPHLRILATSREALDIGGEAVLAVPPLTIPDPALAPTPSTAGDSALALFAERAAAAVPGFGIAESNRACVTRICARLDGLPLAIELAAARLRTLSPEQILSRLDDRYGLLTRGRRGAPLRQQTLRWCIGWSYDLCTPDEQRWWRRLSVFAGGFELDAAARLCGDDPAAADMLDAVSGLVDKSIVIREDLGDTVRFRMLETVGEYGRQRAQDSGEYAEWSRRHREWALDLVLRAETEWIGPHQLTWVARLERELPNVRAALESAVSAANETAVRMTNALYPFWMMRGRLSEGRRWSARALAGLSTGAPLTEQAKALHAAVAMAVLQRDFTEATDRLAQLRQLAEQSTDPLVGALHMHAEGSAVLMTADADPARADGLLTGALEIYTALDELSMRLDVLISLGWSCVLLGGAARATDCFDQVLTTTEAAGETMLRSWALAAAGYVAWRAAATYRAVDLLEKGIRAARQVPDPLVAAACVEELAWITAERDRHRRATVLMGAADSLAGVTGSSPFVFPALLRHRTECELACRDALSSRVFETSLRRGAAMTFDAAVEYALGERATAPTPRRHE
ncbi:protein kinase [Nocardia sp. NPDC051833]|uniref:protein kinase domain-containing protein n=1 Tax=Nocardia sp. NPDC051833 TaxID=3155674 RepID=UPI00341E9DC7